MKVKSFFFFVVFFISISLFAQKIAVSPVLDIRSDDSFSLIGLVKNKILTFRHNESKNVLNIYDDKLNRTIERKMSFEKKRIEVIAISSSENDWVLVYSYRKKSEEIINAIRYDNFGVKLDSVHLATKKYSFSSSKIRFVESEDENKLLLFMKKNRTKMEFLNVDLITFKNSGLKTLEFKDVNLHKDFRKITLSNEGDVFMLFEKRTSFFTREKHRYIIKSISSDLLSTKEKVLKLKFESENVLMKYDNINEELNIVSLITKAFSSKTKGYYLCKMKKDLSVNKIVNRNYRKKYLQNYYKFRNKKPRSYLRNMVLKDLLMRNDGGVMIMMESKEIISRKDYGRMGNLSMRPSGLTHYNTDYIYGELGLISLHNDGSEFWSDVIFKNQISTNDFGVYSSFFVFKNPSELRLVFNDAIKDENQIMMYSVNPLGDIDRKSIFSTDLYNLNIAFTKSIQISSNKFIVPSYKKNTLKLVMIEFE